MSNADLAKQADTALRSTKTTYAKGKSIDPGWISALDAVSKIGKSNFVLGLCLYLPSDMQKAKDLTGATWARIDFGAAQPQDALVAAVRAGGLEPLGVISYTTPQQNGGRGDSHYPPTPAALFQYAKDAAALVSRYGLNAIEPWNEAFSDAFWKPKPDPVAYLTFVKAVATEVWKVNNKCLILPSSEPDYSLVGGAGLPPFTRWIRDLLATDTGKFLTDPRIRPAAHPYCGKQSPQTGGDWPYNRYEWIFDDYKAHGHPDPQCWLTEVGWETPGWATLFEQATYMVDAIKMARASGKVEAVFGFQFHTGVSGDTEPYNWIDTSGNPRPICGSVKAALGG